MTFTMDAGAGGLEGGGGIYKARFVQMKPELYTWEKSGDKSAVAVFVINEETAEMKIRPDEALAYFVWQMTGKVAPVAIRQNVGAMFAFAQQEMVGCKKSVWVQANKKGYPQYVVPEPERFYTCRFSYIHTRDESGLAYDAPGFGTEEREKNRYAKFVLIIQDGEYAGWRVFMDVKAGHEYKGVDKDGKHNFNVSPFTIPGQCFIAMGVTLENAQDWVFRDDVNPWPTWEAALQKLAPTSPFKLPINAKGYAEPHKKIRTIPLDDCPNVVLDPLDSEGGGVATGGGESQFLELLGIAAEILDGETGPIAVGIKLNQRGKDAGAKLFKPLLGLTDALEGTLKADGSVLWPPSKWGKDAMADAIMVLTALTKNIPAAQAALAEGDEALQALVIGNLADEPADVAEDDEMPF